VFSGSRTFHLHRTPGLGRSAIASGPEMTAAPTRLLRPAFSHWVRCKIGRALQSARVSITKLNVLGEHPCLRMALHLNPFHQCLAAPHFHIFLGSSLNNFKPCPVIDTSLFLCYFVRYELLFLFIHTKRTSVSYNFPC